MMELKDKNNIVIVGGGLFNKGAQAMTFTTVNAIKKKFPEKEIYLFSIADYNRPLFEKELYNFSILPWDLKIKLIFLGLPLEKFKKVSIERENLNHIQKVFENSFCFIDISGFALMSQWGFFSTINYLLNIYLAKKFSSPYIIFPQTIGPFDYPYSYRYIVYLLFAYLLRYPKKIFLREKIGLKSIYKFTTKNVDVSKDIVLISGEYDLKNIYKKHIELKKIKIKAGSVGLVPNRRLLAHISKTDLHDLYKYIIDRILESGKKVYIFRHSFEDLEVCSDLKCLFKNEKDVILIKDDLSCIELEMLIIQFDFLVASRYHSIVHAYKNFVPVIAIGWAGKYAELLSDFEQSDYLFDIRGEIDNERLDEGIKKILKDHKTEKLKIRSILRTIDSENVFRSLVNNH